MDKIFVCEIPENIKRIFATEERVYSKADILSGGFEGIRYIFSTWGMPAFTEQEIKKYLPSLEAVFYGAGTVQTFARPFLNCGIRVFSAWAANAVPVAEYTVAQIILANKGFFKTMRYTDRREANQLTKAFPGNYGVSIGIIGAGMIGKLVIGMLKAYNLDVLVFDPFLPEEKARELGVEKVSLETLFARCQVVSNHLANNAQTKGMLHGALLETMLPYATFINTGRGAQVVEADLIRVLRERPDLTAILDVPDPEPPVADSLLYTMPNCILTPHIAGSLGNEVRRMGRFMEEEFACYLAKKTCKYEVTHDMLETMA